MNTMKKVAIVESVLGGQQITIPGAAKTHPNSFIKKKCYYFIP